MRWIGIPVPPLLLLLLAAGCGGREGGDQERVPVDEAPREVLRSPDSLRHSEPLPVPDSILAADSLVIPDSALAEPGVVDSYLEDVAPGDSLVAGGEEIPPSPGQQAMAVRPTFVRGIYLNAWTAGSSRRREALINLARRTELNSFVIDIKDATGFISHPTELSTAREVGATGEIRIRDLQGLLGRLVEEGIYPIARIVVAKDPILTRERPEWAIQDTAGGVWVDQDSVRWLNLHDPRVWDYHVDLAREVVAAGFPEIQWDYVRFPDAPEHLRARAVYPGKEGRPETEAVAAFLRYSREVLGGEGARVTADVFGVTTSYRRDVGIGQLWEAFIGQVDVALPMVYPSHYWTGSFGYEHPNAYPYEIVRRALRDAVTRSAAVEGAGAVRPWLQDFSLGDPAYGAPEVRAQIQATYDAGVQEWVLWNPGSRYTEGALMPEGGLPSWLEPVMRVGGQVVPVSKRFQVLGEEEPERETDSTATSPLPEAVSPAQSIRPGHRGLKVVPLPDTLPATGRTGRGL